MCGYPFRRQFSKQRRTRLHRGIVHLVLQELPAVVPCVQDTEQVSSINPCLGTCVFRRSHVVAHISSLTSSGRHVKCRPSHGDLVASPIHERWGLWRQMYEIRIEQFNELLILDSDLMPPECKVNNFVVTGFVTSVVRGGREGEGPNSKAYKRISRKLHLHGIKVTTILHA